MNHGPHLLWSSLAALFLTIPVHSGGLDEQLGQILDAARATESSALVILQDGEPLAEYYAEDDFGLLHTMSVTKSVVALGVGRMLTTGDLDSLDTPVADYFPEWRQGRKQDITIRHLLSHTSGIQNERRADEEIYPSSDFVQLALTAELDHPPGEHFAYNNKATNLIAGLFPRIVGQRMDHYISEQIFEPLGIEEWDWDLDDSGNPQGMAGLRLHPSDLAALGQLVLDEGRHEDSVIIESEVVAKLLESGSEQVPTSGLLWWRQPAGQSYHIDEELLSRYEEAGVDGGVLEKMASIMGRYSDRDEVTQALTETFGPNWQSVVMPELAPHGLPPARPQATDEIVAWYGEGYLGQFLVVVPETGIVGVRMIKPFDGVSTEHGFAAFPSKIAGVGRR